MLHQFELLVSGFLQNVVHVNRATLGGSASLHGAWSWTKRMTSQPFGKSRPRAMGGSKIEKFAIELKNMAALGPAEPGCTFDERLENRSQVERRSAYDFKHIGRRGLLLQRSREIVAPLAQVTEQPRVLDGDDGLRRKILDQRNLVVGKRADVPAINCNHANEIAVFEHRHDENSPRTGNLRDRFIGIFRGDVGNVRDLLCASDSIKKTCRPTGGDRIAALFGSPGLWSIVKGDVPKRLVFVEQQIAEAGLAEAHCIFQD